MAGVRTSALIERVNEPISGMYLPNVRGVNFVYLNGTEYPDVKGAKVRYDDSQARLIVVSLGHTVISQEKRNLTDSLRRVA